MRLIKYVIAIVALTMALQANATENKSKKYTSLTAISSTNCQ